MPANRNSCTKADYARAEMLQGLIGAVCDMTPAEVDAWFAANVTDLPTAREHLRRLTHLVAHMVWLLEEDQRACHVKTTRVGVDT